MFSTISSRPLGRVLSLSALIILTAWPFTAIAQSERAQIEVHRAVKHDLSRPLRTIPPSPPFAGPQREAREPKPLPLPPQAQAADPVLQTQPSSTLSATSGMGFDGIGIPNYAVQYAPPDTNGAAGTTQYVEWVNVAFAVFDKSSGLMVYGPAAGKTLWQGFGGPCEQYDDGDPIVLFDKAAQRWIFTQFAVSQGAPYMQCVAVSTTSDATGSYDRYSFSYSNFNDYPKLGIWPDGYYVTYNMFKPLGFTYQFLGSRVCAWDRAAMLAGAATATEVCVQLSSSYGGLLPADMEGSTPPPSGSPEYALNFGSNSVRLWKFAVNWASPSSSVFTGPANIPVAAFSAACSGGGTCIPQMGTSQKLDSLADRLMYRLSYRNFGDHESIVVNHSVTAGTSVGVRWYELRNPGGTPTVFQQGTYAPDSAYRWMGSIATDAVGNMLMGYSVSSSSLKPSIRYTGRLATDALNSMQSESAVYSGSGSQFPNLSRWGDYSSVSVDPVDDCTFWYTTEYLRNDGTWNWSTRIASFSYPTCSSPTSLPPPAPTGLTATAGDARVSLTWNASSGATSYSVYRRTSSGGEASALSTTSGTSYVDTAVYNGTTYYYKVNASNAAGTSGFSNEASATPQPAPSSCTDFRLTASRTSVSLSRSGSGTSTISLAPVGSNCTYTGTVNFTATISTGLKGISATLSPTSATGPSGSTILTVSAGGKRQSGSATVTVTATDAVTGKWASVTVLVTM